MWASEISALRFRSARAACGLAGALALTSALAQSQKPVVTEADIARAAKSQPAITEREIQEAAKKHRMPTDAELARVPVPATPRIDALPQPMTQRKVDLGAIARGYEAMGSPSPGDSSKSGPALLVFVSFSMPEPTLQRLVEQASQSGATILLRGFADGSLQQTVTRAQRLIGQRQVGFQLDPQAFDRFSVTATPTFVLIKDGATPAPCAAGTCYPASSFAAVAGDVSIDYALEYFKRSAPSFGREANSFLTKLRRK